MVTQVSPSGVDAKAVESLRNQMHGEIIPPEHPEYDQARRVYNAMHDRRPRLIVRVKRASDVVAAINFARERGVLLAVRGGAHSVAGYGTCDGGIVIDLSGMRGMAVDPAQKVVRAEGGCTWADFNNGTHAFGLAATGGVVSTTGIAGLTLGGGLGYLNRQFGLSCDSLISADVVTANGKMISCSEERHGDLFWALRGGGGNFGVVTSFEYRIHPVSEIFGGPTFFPLQRGVLQAYRDFVRQAPERLGAILGITRGPALPFVSETWHGKPVAVLLACWTGPVEEGRKLLQALDEWGPIVGQNLNVLPYPVINTLFDELLPAGLLHYWKGRFCKQLPDEAIDVHVEHGMQVPCVESGTFVFPINGACQRVTSDETAFAYRDASFSIAISGSWKDAVDNEANVRWVRDYDRAIAPYSEEGGYVNFMADDAQPLVEANYRQNLERLEKVKAKYDPENLFRVNQNIRVSIG